MSVLVVGISHRTAGVPLLERTALDPEGVAKLLLDLDAAECVSEVAVLATCNRLEVHADVDRFHSGVDTLTEMLVRHTGVPMDELAPSLFVHYEERAVAHVLGVACGLDSMVVGEGQVVAQVRGALRGAQAAGTAGRVLNELFQQALRVGKRARTETGIDGAGASVVSVGLDLAAEVLGPLAGRRALVVGAGSMSSLAAATLARAGLGEVVVVNRTPARALRLAQSVGGRASTMDELDAELAAADLVVSCTGAVGTVVPAAAVERAQAARGSRPLVLLDLALPRDVEAAAAQVPGVTVVDLERLGLALAGDQRTHDVEAVRAIVAEEVEAFSAWRRSSGVAPTVVALRQMAAGVVDGELARLAGRLPDLDDHEREEITHAVRRVVDKLLHAPTVRVKALANEPGGDAYALALRELFDLPLTSVEAVTRPGADVPAGFVERVAGATTGEVR